MVWVCEFQHKNESPWAFVYGLKKEAIAQGIELETNLGMKKVNTSEFSQLDDGEYHVYKTDHYYFGA